MKKLFRIIRRFFWDWRTGATIAFAILAGLVIVQAAKGYEDNARLKTITLDQRAAASRRIDALQAKIDTLLADQQTNTEQRARLSAQLDALSEQVRQLGGRPVVTDSSKTTTTTTSPQKQPTGSPQSPAKPGPGTTTPAPPPSTTTTTTPCRKVSPQVPICIG